jgi:hypothetical protein
MYLPPDLSQRYLDQASCCRTEALEKVMTSHESREKDYIVTRTGVIFLKQI